MDSSGQLGQPEAEEGAGEDIEADEGADEEAHTEPGHMSHPFSMYEPHYQQMHPLIYYGDEFGYQQLSHIMSGGKVEEQHQQQQHQVLHLAAHGLPVKQEETLGDDLAGATVLHFGPAATATPTGASTTIPHHGICRLELDYDQQQQQQQNHQHHPLESAHTNTDLASAVATSSSSSSSHRPTEDSLPNETTTTTNNNHPPAANPSNRELHNEIERRRRSRIKYCCEVLRTLVPGISDKTDKATVLEQTVKFMNHLVNCPNFRCNCEIQIEERKQY